VCEILCRNILNDWFRFLEEYGEEKKVDFHLDKALKHHITVYKRDVHRKFSLVRYRDGGDIIKRNEHEDNCQLIVKWVGGKFSLCSSITPSVREEWKRFIKECDLYDVNALHIETALLNYIELWDIRHQN
jgi:hypothetical protein